MSPVHAFPPGLQQPPSHHCSPPSPRGWEGGGMRGWQPCGAPWLSCGLSAALCVTAMRRAVLGPSQEDKPRPALHHRKPRKQKACPAARREDFSHGQNSGSAQSNAEGAQVGTEVSTVSSSASTVSDSGQTELSLSAQFNESLRWDGILEDPAAEEERLQTYRLNRRKRYGLYLQQHHPTAGHLPSPRSRRQNKPHQLTPASLLQSPSSVHAEVHFHTTHPTCTYAP
uniref:Protein LIAT1 n=1 Tax=Pavo cristatus TaxID=9049 RepID=A0A8C9LEW0_PAVCR